MRSPVGYAILFTTLLVAWVASGPVQRLLAGDGPVSEAMPTAGSAASERPLMTVRVMLSAAQIIAPELVVNGRTEAVRTVQLAAETSGRVVETPPAEGAFVEAGAVVARLDLRDRESSVAEMRATVAQRELQYEAARRLGAKQFQSETRVAEALAQLEAARAALHRATLDVEHATITAPFAGVLERRMVEVGDYVESGDPVAEVIELDPLLIVGDAAETVVERLALGEPGIAVLAAGGTVAGRIRYVASRAEAATRTFRVELEIPNADGRIPAGMSASIVVREPGIAAHRVSAGALVLADDGTIGIKAVDPDGTVKFYPARFAKAESEAVWLAGLPERLQIVVTGQGFVAVGERVAVEVVPTEGPT